MTTRRDELKEYAAQHGWREQNQYGRACLFLERTDDPQVRMEITWISTAFARIDHVLILDDQGRSGSTRIRQLTGGMPSVKRYLKEKA